jgi:hypothetical protein
VTLGLQHGARQHCEECQSVVAADFVVRPAAPGGSAWPRLAAAGELLVGAWFVRFAQRPAVAWGTCTFESPMACERCTEIDIWRISRVGGVAQAAISGSHEALMLIEHCMLRAPYPQARRSGPATTDVRRSHEHQNCLFTFDAWMRGRTLQDNAQSRHCRDSTLAAL